MRIYIATSWKNESLAKIVATLLREEGHDVDCFCETTTGRYCFKWTDHFDKIDECDIFGFLTLSEARKAFLEDRKWIDWCDAVVMIYPCGNSAHLEGGYAKGKGKKLFIWGVFPQGYFENMYGFADGIFGPNELNTLCATLKGMNVPPENDPEMMPRLKFISKKAHPC
jgi:hypothetical protein